MIDKNTHENISEKEAYDQLSYYTLSHTDPMFIHQYIVDAYAAEHANENPKPINTAFALAGLYLHHERKYSGKEVQLAHMKMTRKKKVWPQFIPPTERGEVHIIDVLNTPPGMLRDQTIEKWSAGVWATWKKEHLRVAEWVKSEAV